MLKIKFYKNFKGSESSLLVVGDREDYIVAGDALAHSDHCQLSSVDFIALENLGPVNPDDLSLTRDECHSFAEICQRLASEENAAHYYLSLQCVPELDLLISLGEYSSLP